MLQVRSEPLGDLDSMCLAVPGKVVEWIEREPPFTKAMVEFGGVRRDVSMACLPEAAIGDYVLVHAGMAISRIDTEEANRIFEFFEEYNAFEDEEKSERFINHGEENLS